jgi:quercetin dioxygenase-like cupin family protein
MKVSDLNETRVFDEKAMKKFLIHDSAWFRIINFNLSAGLTFPVHSHSLEGQLSIQVLEGEGFFLGAEGAEIPASQGQILVCDIAVPHGVKAKTDMRVLVTIAPPI